MDKSMNDQGSSMQTSQKRYIILAGASGVLGHKIAANIINKGGKVKALIRKGGHSTQLFGLQKQGLVLQEVDYNNSDDLIQACTNGACVVSALNGLEDVIVGIQGKLLKAAIDAGVPRFIPSDYCIDYTKLPYGSNRNLDLRRKFIEQLNRASIAATSILNGMFTDLLLGEAPVILFKIKRVLYWGDKDQLMDFTTIDNTAEYTACAALDSTTPRFLRIAGEIMSANDLKKAASAATGQSFHLLKAGGLGTLNLMIKITRALMPKKEEVFPPWQGMQYLHNMLSGLPKLRPLDNDRYPGIEWTSIREVLETRNK